LDAKIGSYKKIKNTQEDYTMLLIIAKNTVKQGTAEAFKEAAKPLIEGSRAEEGNISYDLFEDVANPNVLTFVERWKDEAAIKMHNASAHFTQAIPKLSAFAAADMDVITYRQTL
jgi:quinol monooxygenase YgiN